MSDEPSSVIRRAASNVGDWFGGSWPKVLANAGIAGFVCAVLWFLVKTTHDDNREDRAIMRLEANDRENRIRMDFKEYQAKSRERVKGLEDRAKDLSKAMHEIAIELRDMNSQLNKLKIVSSTFSKTSPRIESVIKSTAKGMK